MAFTQLLLAGVYSKDLRILRQVKAGGDLSQNRRARYQIAQHPINRVGQVSIPGIAAGYPL